MWYNWQRAQKNCYEESKQVTGKQTSKQKKFNELRKKFNKQKEYWTKEIEFDLNHKEFQSLQKDTTDSGTEELNKMKNTLESIRNTEDHMGKRITEQVDRTLDVPQIEEERGSFFFFFKWGNYTRAISFKNNFRAMVSQEEESRRRKQKVYFKKLVAERFPTMRMT